MDNFIEYILLDRYNWEDTTQKIIEFIKYGQEKEYSFKVFDDSPIKDMDHFLHTLYKEACILENDHIIFYDPTVRMCLNGWVLHAIQQHLFEEYEQYTWIPFTERSLNPISIF